MKTDIRKYGACGDGTTKDTEAIQAAIDACAQAGGGTVVAPAGTYVTGTLFLRSHVTLHLEAGATLLGSPDRADYNADDCFPENNVFACENATGAHLLIAYRCTHVAITGEGCIDGNSGAFLDTRGHDLTMGNRACRLRGDHFGLPDGQTHRLGQMVQFSLCEHVRVAGVQLRNPQYWTLFLHGCRDVWLTGLNVTNPPQTPNGDGIDVDCCERVIIANCIIRTADDCITLRANNTPLGGPYPCRDVTVSNCVLSSKCNAIRVGVGNGTIQNCSFSNLSISDTRTAISINASIPCLDFSAVIEHLRFSDIMMDAVIPLYMTNSEGTEPLREGAGIRNIVLSGIQGRAAGAMLVSGMPACPIRDVTLRDVNLEFCVGSDNRVFLENGVPYPVDGAWGSPGYETIPCAVYVRNAEGVTLDGVTIQWFKPGAGWLDAVQLVHANRVRVMNCVCPPPHPGRGTALRADGCEGIAICHSVSAPGTPIQTRSGNNN